MFAVPGWLTGLLRPRRGRAQLSVYQRGLLALEMGKFEQAIEDFSLALELARGNERARTHNKRGVANIGCERRAEALADFQAALAIDNRFAPALVNVGNVLLEEGRVEEAIASYEAAIRSDDAYAPAFTNLGIAYRRLGRRSASVRALKTATRLELRGKKRSR